MRQPEPKQTIVFIAGAGKSGTSLVSSVISDILGYQDTDQFQNQMDNILGYFENKSVVAINNSILEEININWPTLTQRVTSLDKIGKNHINKAKDLLQQLLKQNSHIVLKDPRFSVTLPWWLSVSQQYQHKIVYVFRNPLEVAHSLLKSASIPIEESLSSWNIINEVGLAVVNTNPTLIISYPDLLADPGQQIKRICEYLGVSLTAERSGSVLFNVEPSIRHYNFKDSDLKSYQNGTLTLKLLKDIETKYRKNLDQYTGKKADVVLKPLSADEKLGIMSARMGKLDDLIRRQFDLVQATKQDYETAHQDATNLTRRNDELARELDTARKQLEALLNSRWFRIRGMIKKSLRR